jgi:hypothetical protein
MSSPPIDPVTVAATAALDLAVKAAKGKRKGGNEIIITINPIYLETCKAALVRDETFWGYKWKSAHQVNDKGDIVWGDSKRSK